MLDATLTTQLSSYLAMLRQPIRLIASLDDSAKAGEMRTLLDGNRRTVRQGVV